MDNFVCVCGRFVGISHLGQEILKRKLLSKSVILSLKFKVEHLTCIILLE